MTNDVFLSYRRTDQALAQSLVEALQKNGVKVWWDQMIEGGEDWRDAIVENLTGARALVILFSEECNSSKQLKKELSIADGLDKEVIPVLIEDTKPKGHYLYELSARNWLRVFPEPELKIDELASRLAFELGTPNTSGGPWTSAAESATSGHPSTLTSAPPISVPAAQSQPAIPAETVEKLIEANEKLEASAKDRRDFMPFKWYEILIAVIFGGLTMAGGVDYDTGEVITGSFLLDFLGSTFLVLLIIAMVVFPFRYYFRGRRVGRAVRYYAITILILVIAVGIVFGTHPDFMDETMGATENFAAMLIGSIFLFGFVSVLTFSTYGLMHFQRNRRSFNQHIEHL